MSFCFSRAASVASWLTTRSSRSPFMDRVVDGRRLHVEGQFEQPGAVGPRACRIRTWRRPTARRRSRPRRSRRHLSSGGRPGSTDGSTWNRSAANAWMSLAGIHGAPRLASMSPGSTSSGCTARKASALRAYAGPALLGGGELGPDVAGEIGVGGLPGLRFRVVEDQVAQLGDDLRPRACRRASAMNGRSTAPRWLRETSNPSSALRTCVMGGVLPTTSLCHDGGLGRLARSPRRSPPAT